MQSKATRLYRVKAVAEMFDVHPSTIYRAIESGKLRALRIGGGGAGALRVSDSAIDEFSASCEEATYEEIVAEGERTAPAGSRSLTAVTNDVVAGEVL